MTGFTDIIEIKKAFREVSVEGCEIIGKGGHGTVYRLDGDTIIKLYGAKGPLDEIEREISYSKKAFVFGIPTAISFDIVKCGDCYGVVFELINADTLANRICAEPESFDEYSEKYSALVKKLHETDADTSIFGNIKDLYNKWIDDLKDIYTPDEIAVLHEVINSIPDSNKFVHGDIHPKNIMVQDGELLFIDIHMDILFSIMRGSCLPILWQKLVSSRCSALMQTLLRSFITICYTRLYCKIYDFAMLGNFIAERRQSRKSRRTYCPRKVKDFAAF